MTVIMNIHHVELALEYASRIIGIRAGEIVYDGRTEDVTDEILEQIYKGSVEKGEDIAHAREAVTN